MGYERTFVGLDVHARSVVACGIDGQTGEITRARLTPDHEEIWHWISGLEGPVAVAYEAGPTGFGLARFLSDRQTRCVVAAASKITRAPGDRVKTDAREDCRGDLMSARHRLSKLLLRQGIVWSGGQAWTGAHDAWLRRDRLDEAIAVMAADSEFTPVVRRLGCLRGISTLTGFGLAVEIGDWHRFTGSTIGAYVGLVPSESSSGQSRSQGSITKTGNTHVRRLLVEAAWHHRRRSARSDPRFQL